MNQVVIFAFSQKGRALSRKIGACYAQVVYVHDFKEHSLKEQIDTWFHSHRLLIFVGATGIAVRGIAPFIQGKDVDPAVLVVDELGRFVIPLLSGHLGGANAYGEALAKQLEATPVITTATDINRIFAVDLWAKKQNLYINNIDCVKYISAAALSGEEIGFYSEYSIPEIPECVMVLDRRESQGVQAGILISDVYQDVFPHTLWLTPKKYVIGVGCRKGIETKQFEEQLLIFLREKQIPIYLVQTLASIDLKEKEQAILDFSRKYGIEFLTYSAPELVAVAGEFHTSEFVQSVTGVDNVCERSARLASGAKELFLGKTVVQGMTMAVCLQEDYREEGTERKEEKG